MMGVSQKSRYALRATFELAKRHGSGPIPSNEIAAKQAIPPRFLELILNQLVGGGIIQSRRGARGGYHLIGHPRDLTVGRLLRLTEGDVTPVDCELCGGGEDCPLAENCVFSELWNRAETAMLEVYDGTSFQDLVDQHRQKEAGYLDYSI
ncbi:MAG: RrF2 family transcriptional regulator [Phycisphaerae bacterium]